MIQSVSACVNKNVKQQTSNKSRSDAYTAFMLDHVAGNLSGGLALAADIHAKLSEDGERSSLDWSVVGGAMLEFVEDGPVVATRTKTAPTTYRTADDLLSEDFSQLVWRTGVSGVGYAKTGVKGGRFMRLKEGQSAPSHGHGCIEATVVLSGAFEDGRGRYERGDIALLSPGERHEPRAVDGDCVCFVAREKGRFWIL